MAETMTLDKVKGGTFYVEDMCDGDGPGPVAVEKNGIMYIYSVPNDIWRRADYLDSIFDPDDSSFMWWDETPEEKALEIAKRLRDEYVKRGMKMAVYGQ